MGSKRVFASWVALNTLSCAPASVDYSALTTAAEARQRDAGTRVGTEQKTTQTLLARPLTAESAAQIAVLNNRGVRASVEELGIAEAQLAAARRLPNPTLEGAVRFRANEQADIEVGALLDITDLLLLAARSSAASAEVDAAKLAAVGAILDLSFDARRAFYDYQAALELVSLRRTVLDAFSASAELAVRLRAAGNITELDLATQQALYEEARLTFQDAEIRAANARERLNQILGLWGPHLQWSAEARLPDPPAEELNLGDVERVAIERSLDLTIIKQRYAAAARRANIASISGFLPELKAGVSAERDEEWAVGPAVELEVPLFYQGQGEVGVAKAQMRQQQSLFAGVAVDLRAQARDAALQLSAYREAALYYKKALLPLKQKVVEQSQLEYNAMLIGLFQLLQAKRDQVQTGVDYVERLHRYWLARTNVEQLRAGRRPERLSSTMSEARETSGTASPSH